MGVHVVLLRGINVGPHNRVAMPALRQALAGAGYTEVRSYLQSGNLVLGGGPPERIGEAVSDLIAATFGLQIAVVTRTADELAAVVARDPLPGAANDPKRYQVSFLSEPAPPDLAGRLEQAKAPDEQVVVDGREIYAYHPAGIARSKLWAEAAKLGTRKAERFTATARNWSTVTALAEMGRL